MLPKGNQTKISFRLAETNDPQMREDLLISAVGIVTMLKNEDAVLKDYAKWMFENIFSKEKNLTKQQKQDFYDIYKEKLR